jgi:hypothetical protein
MVTARTALLVLLSTCALAACGDDDAGDERRAPAAEPGARPRAVQGYLDLERAGDARPDAGTQAGHRGGGARATATSSRFEFTGTAQPSEARVTVTGADAEVDHRRDGVFVVTVRGLSRGTTELTVTARRPGLAPWSEPVRITRR